MTNRPSRLVVLISGTGSIMMALAQACQAADYGARIVAVISDRADAAGLMYATQQGIATAVVAPGDFPDRATWDEGLARTVATFDPDLVVCAGFMRLIGAPLLGAYAGRIVNTHPALLPSFPGAHGVRDALAAGVKITGCSVMLVDEGVDTGVLLAQEAVRVREDDTETTLHERIKVVERDLVVRTVGVMVRHGWTVEGRHTRLGKSLEGPQHD